MDNQDYFHRQIHDMERDRRKQERKEKWEKREKGFWKAFLFTEDGKPKSGLMIYTFCLSFVLLGFYIAAFYLSVEYLTPCMAGFPAFLSNLLQALAASAAGVLMSFLLHKMLPDKRLIFGSHLWLLVYAVAAVITLLIFLWGTGAAGAMFVFFGWCVAIPLTLGLAAGYAMYRHDYAPPASGEEAPEWTKYTRRR